MLYRGLRRREKGDGRLGDDRTSIGTAANLAYLPTVGCATCITKDPVHTGGQVPLMQYNGELASSFSAGLR